MIESKESKTRDIPVWLTALVVLLCIGGGALLIRWYMKEQPRQVVEVPEDKTYPNNPGKGFRGQLAGSNGGGGGNARFQPVRDTNADGIQRWSSNTNYRAKIGNTIMMVNVLNGGRTFDVSPQYLTLRTPEEAEMAMLRMSVIQQSAWREYLNVTDEQRLKLVAVPPAQSMQLDPADKARLIDLWKVYYSHLTEKGAPSPKKADAEKQVLAALDETGKKNFPASKQYEANRAELVRKALTPEQIKLYQDAGGKVPAPAPPAGTIVPAKPAATKVEAIPADKAAVVSRPVPTPVLATPVVNTAATKSAATAPTTKPAAVTPAVTKPTVAAPAATVAAPAVPASGTVTPPASGGAPAK